MREEVGTRVWIRVSVTMAIVVLCAAGAAMAQHDEGAHLYRLHCAGCHGPSGRGDGPDADIFVVRPRDLREGLLKKYTPSDLARWVRDGRALELVLDPAALAARAHDVEDLVAYLMRFPTINWQRVQLGWGSYVDHCERCHGTAGRPNTSLPAGVKSPRDLSDPAFQRSVSDTKLIGLVRHGRRGMPPLTPRIPKSDAAELAAFVRLLSPGFTLYRRDCASCHGSDGRGVAALSGPIRLPTTIFDRQYFAAHDAEYLRTRVWHMVAEHRTTMPHHGAMLSEAQARAVVEYLKQMAAGR
jgi:mono/diheme cytochrome c family protein